MSLIHLDERDRYTRIVLPKSVSGKALEELQAFYNTQIEKLKELYVFDFSGVLDFHPDFLRMTTQFNLVLKKQKASIASYGMTKTLFHEIRNLGLDKTFCPGASYEAVLKEKGLTVPKTKLDVALLNPFIAAALNTLEVQASTKLQAGKPFVRQTQDRPEFRVCGEILLQTSGFKGIIRILFPASVLLQVYNRMVGENLQECSDQVEESAGEILNIIFGQAKAELNKNSGLQINQALPKVIRGSNQISTAEAEQKTALTIVVPLQADSGTVHLEIGQLAS